MCGESLRTSSRALSPDYACLRSLSVAARACPLLCCMVNLSAMFVCCCLYVFLLYIVWLVYIVA